jgi:hypothetical protein
MARSGCDLRHTRLLIAIGIVLSSTLLNGRQGASPTALSGTLRTHLEQERFGIVTSIRGLPLGVRDELRTLFGSATVDIAEPGGDFQSTDKVAKPHLPLRRLVAAGCAADHHCLVYYERGGTALTRPVALFQWSPAATRFEWGGTAPGGLATIEDVRKAILSGAIKGPNNVW